MSRISINVDPQAANLAHLVRLARQEATALEAVLPAAMEAQWETPPSPAPSEDTKERSKGLQTDPTASIALDDRRATLSDQVRKSERALRNAVVALAGVRLGLTSALEAWEGNES